MGESVWAGVLFVLGLVFILIDVTVTWTGTVFHMGPFALLLGFLLYRRRYVTKVPKKRA